jgi:hypothetical protein
MPPKAANAGQEVHFQHAPLDLNNRTIRLVKISRQLTWDGSILCQMKHVTINNVSNNRLADLEGEMYQPSGASNQKQSEELYTCLSYTWGDPSPEYSIKINGERYHVRKSLWEFLDTIQFWDAMTEIWFWIDAICIDQKNNIERNHQVQQMGVIYSQADRVIIWLGRDLEPVGVLQRVNAYNPYDTGQSASHPIFETTTRSFCYHNYWSRAWITQEVALAKRVDVIAGMQVTGFKRLMSIVGRRITNSPFLSITDYMQERTYTNPRVSYNDNLLRLIHQFRRTNCAIPRDRIYSLLALCKESGKLKIDYEASEEQVMRQTLEACHGSLCFCAAAIVMDALWSRADTVPLVEDTTPYVEVPVLASQPTSRNACANCNCSLPLKWTSTEGLVICLTEICGDMIGHFLWQDGCSLQGDLMFLVPRQDMFRITHHFCGDVYAEIEWPSTAPDPPLPDTDYKVNSGSLGASGGPSAAILRLSFCALFNMVRNRRHPKDIQRKCRNVWKTPNPREKIRGTTRGRMRLCQNI